MHPKRFHRLGGHRLAGHQLAQLAWTCVLGVALCAAGCASSQPKDPIEKAKRITKLTREAETLRFKFEDQFDRVELENNLKNPSWTPAELDDELRLLARSEGLFRQALEIDKRSPEWRFKLAIVLGHQASLHGVSQVYAEERNRRLEQQGQSPGPEQLEEARRFAAERRRYLELANVEYRFFLNNLLGNAPRRLRGPVFAGLFNNYIYLEDHENIVNLGEMILKELTIGPREKEKVEKQVSYSRDQLINKEIRDAESDASSRGVQGRQGS